jgi:transglutaminase-like putative cysteine protease
MTAILPEALRTPGPAVAPERTLQPSIAVTSTDPRIRAAAAQITADATTDLEKIQHLVQWMQANIKREPMDAFSALDVLDSKRAECQGHAYLYAAFARSLGIPTRVQNGLMYSEVPQGFLYHSWNESLVNGHWLPVDPTFGQVGADATHVKLVEGESPAELLPLLDVIGKLQAQVLSFQ